jgi:hypothetical protein
MPLMRKSPRMTRGSSVLTPAFRST